MQIFDVTPEKVVKPKTCACCNSQIMSGQFAYFGHSNFKSSKGDCSVYICQRCTEEFHGYLMPCSCMENL